MLLSKEKITEDLVDMLMSWRHSGFNVFCGSRMQPGDEKAMSRQVGMVRYIIRASFSQERMNYVPEEDKVAYQSKDGMWIPRLNRLLFPDYFDSIDIFPNYYNQDKSFGSAQIFL